MSASLSARVPTTVLLALGLSLCGATARAADDDEPERRQMSQQEIEAWLDARGMPKGKDVGQVGEEPEVPPPPPRASGLVVESTIGALGHLGPLKNVSPTSPWFNLKVGFEPLSWLMLFGQAELSVANTSYAKPPPDPRTYNMYGFGGGLRITVRPTDRFGIYLQGEVGAGEIDEDVLFNYGYANADRLNLYYGGRARLRMVPGQSAPGAGRPRRRAQLRCRSGPRSQHSDCARVGRRRVSALCF